MPQGKAAPVEVAAVLDGTTLKLADGGVLRLDGILAPRAGTPFAREALAGLAALAKGRLLLFPMGAPADRYGRVRAQAYAERGGAAPLWLQGAMLEQGLARVFTTADSRACAAALLAREAMARKAGRGLWADPAYAVLQADRMPSAARGGFALVEGRIASVSLRAERGYVNFGRRWRSDFTLELEKADLALFSREGYNLAARAGQSVRVRGWLEWLNGPMMRLTHPEQLEWLAEKDGAGEP